MIEISLGQRLHQLRDKADLSLRELARKVGVSSHSEKELAVLGNATASREDGYSVPQCGTQSFEFSPSRPAYAAIAPFYWQPRKYSLPPQAAPPEDLRQEKTRSRPEISHTSLGGRRSILGEPPPKKACGLFHLRSI